MSKYKVLVGLAVTTVIFFYLQSAFDFSAVLHTISGYNPLMVLLATGAVIVSIAASCLRYFSILRSFKIEVDFKTAVRANILGAVGGLLFFHLFGQTLARATVLYRYAVPFATVLITNVYERLLALVFLFLYAVLGALVLYDNIAFDWEGGGADLTKLSLYFGLALLLPMGLVYRRLVRLTLKSLGRLFRTHSLLRDSASTILVHLAMFSAYIVLAQNYVLNISYIDLTAATVLVMFAASLPISFAGWGVREVSAVFAYGVIGIDPVTALSISVLIGILNILALALSASLVSLFIHDNPLPAVRSENDGSSWQAPLNYDRALCLAIPLLAATAILFQVHIPNGSSSINVNLGDPLAIAGGTLFLIRRVKLRAFNTFWILPRFEFILLAFTTVFLYALLHGFWVFGVTNWALYNRGIGWLVLIGYVGTGALIVTEVGAVGQRTVVKTIILSITVIAFLETVLVMGKIFRLHSSAWINPEIFSGMAGNPNAFAFQLLVAVSLLLGLKISWGSVNSRIVNNLNALLLVILLSAIYYTKSRTGLIVSVALLSTAVLFRFILFFQLTKILIGTVVIAMLPYIIPHIYSLAVSIIIWFDPTFASKTEILNYDLLTILKPASDSERWQTIRDGFTYWVSAPILGAGLGVFIQSEILQNGQALIIHSTPIWLLAECGLVGLVTQLSLFWHALKCLFNSFRMDAGPARAALLLLLSYGLFQLPHDMFYQRVLWFGLGILLINSRPLAKGDSSSKNRRQSSGVPSACHSGGVV